MRVLLLGLVLTDDQRTGVLRHIRAGLLMKPRRPRSNKPSTINPSPRTDRLAMQ
jgi:hypothetical protein